MEKRKSWCKHRDRQLGDEHKVKNKTRVGGALEGVIGIHNESSRDSLSLLGRKGHKVLSSAWNHSQLTSGYINLYEYKQNFLDLIILLLGIFYMIAKIYKVAGFSICGRTSSIFH